MKTIRQRIRQWALRRQGQDRLPLNLTSRRVYILPTKAGWTFGALIAVTFIAGMNYGNGLALLFAFWLAAFAMVAMVQTQRSLSGARVVQASASPVFAGESVVLALTMDTPTALRDLHLSAEESTSAQTDSEATHVGSDLVVSIAAPHRGRWHAPPLRLQCTAPFGLFCTWTWLTPATTTLVYPRPAGQRPVPEAPGTGTGGTRSATGMDEFAWLRDFRDGDSPRQVAWKAFARGGPLRVREYRSAQDSHRCFDFDALTPLDTEARLSQLARWIVDAEAQSESWVMRLPGHAQQAGSGPSHRERDLAALAEFGLDP